MTTPSRRWGYQLGEESTAKIPRPGSGGLGSSDDNSCAAPLTCLKAHLMSYQHHLPTLYPHLGGPHGYQGVNYCVQSNSSSCELSCVF